MLAHETYSLVGQLALASGDSNAAYDAYQEARKRRALSDLPYEGYGKPATFNVLFCRDLAAEQNGGLYGKIPPAPRLDQILKSMAIYELHGLNDIAVDIATTFSNELRQRLDVERAIDLLCHHPNTATKESAAPETIERQMDLGREPASLEKELAARINHINELQASTSWRITAPLRALMQSLRDFRK